MLACITKIGEHFTIHWSPFLVVIGALLLMLIHAVLQERTLSKHFIQGKTDAKFIATCQRKIQTLEKTPAGQRKTYIYHTMICVAHLNAGNKEKALEQFNAIRRQDYQHMYWLYFLFIQYFAGLKYVQLHEAHSKKTKGGLDAEQAIRELIRESVSADDAFEEKQAFFRTQLYNDFVVGVFDDFTSIVHSEPKIQ